jgi:hypothetical protein
LVNSSRFVEEAKPWWRNGWVIAVVALAMVGALGLIGTLVGDTDNPRRLAASGDHQQELVAGETPFIAGYLVPVDGYSYADASKLEIDLMLRGIEEAEASAGSDAWGASSLHSVIADDPSQNTTQGEVGFLYLIQFNSPILYGSEEEYARNSIMAEMIDRLDIAGVPVFVFDNPESRNSRYHYVWFEHGVGGTIDGADRGPLEAWLSAYLEVPKLAEHETAELDARLTVVAGYAYSDFDLVHFGSDAEEVGSALPDLAYSMHTVVDNEDPLGVLTLAETENAGPLLRVMSILGLEPLGETDVGGHRVLTLQDSVDRGPKYAFVWTDSGISGAFATNIDDLETSRQFLEAFLESE